MKYGRVRVTTPRLLALLAVMMLMVVLLTPEESVSGGGLSSFSTDPDGARILLELAQRMGWRASRRTTTLDSLAPSAPRANVQVVVGAEETLGGAETHRLLEHVRRGGGLIFSMDGAGEEIADSLGMAFGADTYMLPGRAGDDCTAERRRRERPSSILPPTLRAIVWRRPPPGPVTLLLQSPLKSEMLTTAVAFPLGAGRAAAVSTSELFTNESMRVCAWGADVVAARAIEFVRPPNVTTPTIQFDEFHHGFGTHPGSMTAVTMYLSRTASGHFLAQALIAGLLLLFAAAPRPVVPREAERIVRRSPLEHADALALAYMDVGATRTAAARLVGGLRRRVGRVVPTDPASNDSAFLDAVERRSPALHEQVAVLRRALSEPRSARDMIAIGQAVTTIEQALTSTSAMRA